MTMNPSEKTRGPTSLDVESLGAAARIAFAEHVRRFDERDQVIVHVEPPQLRLIYVSVRASRQSSSATFIQCKVDDEREQMWITSLQVSDALRRQGLGREMVAAAEATARAIGMSRVSVLPYVSAVAFWDSLGYVPESRMSRVLQKVLD